MGTAEAIDRRWTFGRAVLDERTLELTVDGKPARLEPKPLAVLLYLLHHAGEAVTKEELAEALWPGRILTESVLTRHVSQLRQVLKDDDRALIRTIHGCGYRLVAGVKVDVSTAPPPPVLGFKAGDHPPTRPHWWLVERLGTGGHGEAWLARHDKTQDARVFKFALDAGALTSLKREITLYRLLHDRLGEGAAVVRVHEWNVEEPPYFIETEYVAGRDLRVWADAHGGLTGVSLETRLELMAQVAEAVAAAHSVGVLHKDLKPGNVLVWNDGSQPRIKLGDFGSGCVVDPERLEQLGITRMGFTQGTVNVAAGATPLYLAPEVIGGQPFTMASDVYALGIMLYQVIVGDLRQPLASGWQLSIPDELLCEDIAAAAAGNPALRLPEAAQLASRLRTLEARRVARTAEVAARERAQRTQHALLELRRMRMFALTLLILAAAAVAGGVAAYRARTDALTARATTQAINDFLTEGVLSVDPAAEKPKNASYESLLKRAAGQVDARFKSQPEAAASIHWLLGRRFQEVGQIDLARIEYEKASGLLSKLQESSALPALLALDRLIPIYIDSGRRADTTTLSTKLLDKWTARYGHTNLSTMLLRARLARRAAFVGEIKRADAEFRAILAEVKKSDPKSQDARIVLQEWLGVTLATNASTLTSDARVLATVEAHIKASYAGYLGEFAENHRESELRYREALDVMLKLLGEDAESTASARMSLASTLALAGRPNEAEDFITLAEKFFESSLPAGHWLRATPIHHRGRIALEQQRAASAISLLDRALNLCVSGGCSQRIAEEIRYDLGRAHHLSGNLDLAVEIYSRSLMVYERLRGPNHIGCVKRRLSLTDALRSSGRNAEARETLSGVTSEALDALPAPHLVVADYKRIQGLLWAADGEFAKARAALSESLEIVEHRLGNNHWRTLRARAELAKAGKLQALTGLSH